MLSVVHGDEDRRDQCELDSEIIEYTPTGLLRWLFSILFIGFRNSSGIITICAVSAHGRCDCKLNVVCCQ